MELMEETMIILSQLGYRNKEAEKMIEDVISNNPAIETPETLIQEIYKINRQVK